MSHSFDITVDPSPSLSQHRITRMPRRNAIVRRKRGRTDKSKDLRQDLHQSSHNSNYSCESLSGSVQTAAGFPEAIEQEEQRRNRLKVRNHDVLMPLKDLAFLLSTHVTLAQTKRQAFSDTPKTRLPDQSERKRYTPSAAPEA